MLLKPQKTDLVSVYMFKIILHAVFWFLLIFCIGRFVVQKGYLTYSALIETTNLPIISELASEQDVSDVKAFQRQLFYKRIINSTVLLHSFEDNLVAGIEQSYNRVISQEGLSPLQKAIAGYYAHLYANCCSYNLNSSKGYAAFEALALVEFSPSETEEWLKYFSSGVYWVGYTGHRTRTQFKLDSWKNYLVNPIVYSIGERGFRYNSEIQPSDFEGLVQASYAAMQRVNRDFPEDEVVQKLKFILEHSTLKIRFLQKHQRNYSTMSPYNCQNDTVYQLVVLAEDFNEMKKQAFIQSDDSLSFYREAYYSSSNREKCQTYKKLINNPKGDRW